MKKQSQKDILREAKREAFRGDKKQFSSSLLDASHREELNNYIKNLPLNKK
jgi:hypothetical protein